MVFFVLFPLFFLTSAINAQTHRALLVGINNYEPKQAIKSPCRDAWLNLKGCINDVDAMEAILSSSKFGFNPGNIHVLKNEEATRERILTDIKKHLVDEAAPGDICLFYYAGHGSQVKNSKSDEPDKMDETLVPSDWYINGDIRDKELKKLYNRVLDKKALLTVIVDACHSGAISRGIPFHIRSRSLPPNKCDAAEPPDNETSPAERGALIFSAAQDFQAAVETKENNLYHGLFSWALFKVLMSTPMDEPAQNILVKVKAMMQSEGIAQEPNIEGISNNDNRSIFGIQTNRYSGSLRVAVSRKSRQVIELQGGVVLGLRNGCELKKVDTKTDASPIRLLVTAEHGLTRCSARVIRGELEKINVGDLFELDKWVAPPNSSLDVQIPFSRYNYNELLEIARNMSKLKDSTRIDWIEDPTTGNPTHILSYMQPDWVLSIHNGKDYQVVKLGKKPQHDLILKEIFKNHANREMKPRVFLQLPMSVELERTTRLEMEDYSHCIRVNSSEEGIGFHYILVGRYVGDCIEYAWVLPNMTQGTGENFALPVRTAWIPLLEKGNVFQPASEELTDKAKQLVKIRAWHQLTSPDDNRCFPYRLALKNADTGNLTSRGPLIQDETFGLVLRLDEARLKTIEKIEKRYVYVFSIDSDGKGTLLFPRVVRGNVENYFPTTSSPENAPPVEIKLGSSKLFTPSEPFGMDTFILLTTTDAIAHPWVLEFKGVRAPEYLAELSPLESLLYDMDILSRDNRRRSMPTNWSIQCLPVLSHAKEKATN